MRGRCLWHTFSIAHENRNSPGKFEPVLGSGLVLNHMGDMSVTSPN